MVCSPPDSSVHGDSPGKNTRVIGHFLLQGIFLTQGSNTHLLRLLQCRHILYHRATWEASHIRVTTAMTIPTLNHSPQCVGWGQGGRSGLACSQRSCAGSPGCPWAPRPPHTLLRVAHAGGRVLSPLTEIWWSTSSYLRVPWPARRSD